MHMNEELELVQQVLDGDDTAWKRFTTKYYRYIRKVIGSYTGDYELVEALDITLLEKLKAGKLRGFTGKSSLKTWLFIVARNHCRDYYRSKGGIRHIRKAISGLSRLDRRFFEMYYTGRLPIREIFETLRSEMGNSISYLDLLESQARIEKHMRAKKHGRILERLLRPVLREPLPTREKAEGYPDLANFYESGLPSPETLPDSRHLNEMLLCLKEAISVLSDRDKLVLRMRFEHRASARKIGELLGFRDEKQVYRKLDSLYTHLGHHMEKKGFTRDSSTAVVGEMGLLFQWEDMWNDRGDIN